MIYLGNGEYKLEQGEPIRTGCWQCQPAHGYMKGDKYVDYGKVHICYTCRKTWVFDTFLDTLKTTEQWDAFVQEKGIKTQKMKKRVYKPEITSDESYKNNGGKEKE